MANMREESSEYERLTVPIPTAASMLGISRSKLYQLFDTGEIEVIKVGRRTLVVVDSLKAFVEARRRPLQEN